jgi:3-hydroxyisobutyrate dehydrogenase-like beta-hydroxyacid dehydrogenase
MLDTPLDEATIGFVGVGQMGLPMARNVLEAGFPLVACDVREEAVRAVEDAGGEGAATPAAVAERCLGVHVMVVDDDQVTDVVRGEDGVFEGFRRREGGGVVVVHSTVVPDTVAVLAADAPEGVAVLDVAVSGGQPRAETGELTLMVGGDGATLDAYRPVLDAFGRDVYHLGPVGAGLATKLANNLIFHACEAATMEAIDLGTAYGVDREDLLEVFETSTGDNYFLRNVDYFTGKYLTSHPAGLHGPARNARKNLSQALELGGSMEVPLPVTGLVSQRVPRVWHDLADEMAAEGVSGAGD